MDTPMLSALDTGTQPSGPWAPARLGQRALADLRETAERLDALDRPTYDVLMALLRRAQLYRQLGSDLPSDITLRTLRQLPGLSEYDPLANWQKRMRHLPAHVADTIEMPCDVERERRRRANVLADWLGCWAGSDLAERVVCAVEEISTQNSEGSP